MIPTDKPPANVPGRRHMPPATAFSKIMPGPVGHILDDFLRHVRDFYAGLPAPHARTHLMLTNAQLGDSPDGLGATATPSPLSFGAVGVVGNPDKGLAAGDHVHDGGSLAGEVRAYVSLRVG